MYDKIDAYIDEEMVNNDPVFPGLYLNTNDNIKNDINYNRPHSKTWVFTNVLNADIWVDTDGMPMKCTYNNKMFAYSNGKKGVYIVKTYYFYERNIPTINELLRIIVNDDFKIDEQLEELIVRQLQKIKEAMSPISHTPVNGHINNVFNIRIVYFVNMEIIENADVVVYNNFRISNKIDKLYSPTIKEISDEEYYNTPIKNTGEYVIKVTNYSDVTSVFLHICDSAIEIKPEKRYYNSEIIGIEVTKGNTILKNRTTQIKDIVQYREFTRTEENDDTAYREYKDKQLNIMEKFFDNQFKMHKYVYEHQVSLHKLYSYIIREEAAIMGLEKEELSTLKEVIKLLKDIK